MVERSPAVTPEGSSLRSAGHFPNTRSVHIILILLFCLAAHANALHVPFVFDDTNNIVGNPRIRDLSNIPAFFVRLDGVPTSGRPLMAATFALNYRLGGLDPAGYHLVNLLLHLTNALLLYALIITTARDHAADEGRAGFLALAAALIFVVHPVQTESVTYIVSRSVLLSTLFALMGILIFRTAVSAAGMKRALLATALWSVSLLGMASREEFFLFPLILVLYDYYFVSTLNAGRVLGHYGLHLPVICTLSYVLYIVSTFNYTNRAGFGVDVITPGEYLMTQFKVHGTYVRLLLLPMNQNLDYDYPVTKTMTDVPTLAAFLGYAGLWGAGFYFRARGPALSFSVLLFMVGLAPTSSFMPIADVIFEHRLYLPSIGFVLAVPLLLYPVVRPVLRSGNALFVLVVSVAALFAVLTHARNETWKGHLSLFEDVVKKSPAKARGHTDLGTSYYHLGRYEEAVAQYEQAIALDRTYLETYWNLSALASDLEQRGLPTLAARSYNAVCTHAPPLFQRQIAISCDRAARLAPVVREGR
ncbi:MAG: tetratricopeptide repeat protein [Thermodesulfovibrionales bacterium]